MINTVNRLFFIQSIYWLIIYYSVAQTALEQKTNIKATLLKMALLSCLGFLLYCIYYVLF